VKDEGSPQTLFVQCMSPMLALNVTCGNATIPSLSGDERTHRDQQNRSLVTHCGQFGAEGLGIPTSWT
jgi:hypothetical protein